MSKSKTKQPYTCTLAHTALQLSIAEAITFYFNIDHFRLTFEISFRRLPADFIKLMASKNKIKYKLKQKTDARFKNLERRDIKLQQGYKECSDKIL